MSERDELLQKINDIKSRNTNTSTSSSPQIEESSFAGDLARSAGQGLLFGFADELEALFKSATDGNITYDDAIKQARGKLNRFRKENPLIAYGTEIASSLPTAVGSAGLLARLGLKGVGKIGALQGATYGAGAGEGATGKSVGAVGGAVLGGTISKGADKLLPKTTELAKKFLDKGIRLTHGQRFGGAKNITGDFIQGLEDSSTSIIGVGSPLQFSKVTALSDFNRTAIQEALEPLTGKLTAKEFNKLIPRNLHGNELFTVANNLVKSSYDDALSKINIDKTGINLLRERLKFVAKEDKFAKQFLETINKQIDDLISTYSDDAGNITGTAFKQLDSDLQTIARSYKTADGGKVFLNRTFNNIRNEANKVVGEISPTNLGQINTANVGMKIIQRAVNKANKTEGVFSVNQFLDAIKQNDPSVQKILTAQGKGFLQNLGKEAKEVMGSYMPDSGTASRLVSSNVASDPASVVRYLPATLASNIIYGGLGRPATQKLLGAFNPAVRGLLPTTLGQASNINSGLLNRGR